MDHTSKHRSGWRQAQHAYTDIRVAAGCSEWSEYLGKDRDLARIKAAELTARDNERIKRFRSLTPDERSLIAKRGRYDEVLGIFGGTATYAELEAAIAYLREGDVLVVTALDRLARSMRDLLGIVERIKVVGASLRILQMNLNTADATSELILNVIGSVAQWERSRMLERQAEGIALAKAKGKYKGRAPTAMRKAANVRALDAQGVGMTDIARKLDISRTSVWRILSEAHAST